MGQFSSSLFRLPKTAFGALSSLSNGEFDLSLLPIIGDKLRYWAVIRQYTGVLSEPYQEYIASSGNGKPQTFEGIDSAIKWLSEAYSIVAKVNLYVEGTDLIFHKNARALNALQEKAKLNIRLTATNKHMVAVSAKISRAVSKNWHLLTAPPALHANYNELIFQQQSLTLMINYYTARLATYP